MAKRGDSIASHGGHWSIKNYNAFVREVKAVHGISHKEAQKAYASMRDRVGRPVYGSDVKRHPHIAKQEAEKAHRIATREKRAIARARAVGPVPDRAGPAGGGPGAPGPRVLGSIAAYEDVYEPDIEYDLFEYDASGSYGED